MRKIKNKFQDLEKKNFCLHCRTRISIQKAFCSNQCKDIHFENLKIQIPKLFIKRLVQHIKTKEQIEVECKKYAIFHKYNEQLTIEKVFKILEDEHQLKFIN